MLLKLFRFHHSIKVLLEYLDFFGIHWGLGCMHSLSNSAYKVIFDCRVGHISTEDNHGNRQWMGWSCRLWATLHNYSWGVGYKGKLNKHYNNSLQRDGFEFNYYYIVLNYCSGYTANFECMQVMSEHRYPYAFDQVLLLCLVIRSRKVLSFLECSKTIHWMMAKIL